MCFSCICFVYFAHVNFCHFSLGVRNRLRLVIVAHPGLSIKFFCNLFLWKIF